MFRKAVIGGIFTIGLLIFGFIMLLRSCLSQFDERSAISNPVIVESNGQTVVFSLVKFEKTTSYSRQGGFVRKSVSTSYYVQSNDGISGSKLRSKKIKKHSQVKSFPIEVLGVSNNIAWIFAGELMAFDPFTLEKIADAAAIEAKNPSLKGKLSSERRYYEYDHQYGIKLTANDGSRYVLNTSTMIASPSEEETEKDPGLARMKELQKQQESLRKVSDSNYAHFRNAGKLYNERKISGVAYQDSSDRFMKERSIITKLEDSLRKLVQNADEEMDELRDQERLVNTLQSSRHFSQVKVNTDSFSNKWYGILTAEEIEKLPGQFDYRKTFGDADRNKLYVATITIKDPSKKFSKWMIGAEKQKISDAVFLQGGFLLDITTGKPIHLSGPDGFLVVYKEQLGSEAKIMLSRVGIDGKQNWSLNTGLKEFSYWIIHKQRLYVFGTDNKELSSGDINVMHIVDLTTGRIVTHDYFKNKNRSVK
ncbi:MAG: hypothetical protein HOP10_13560 [Chitinophagaceae bacterium]|nr:hypothetical protein [Chitinophagaceae bacterium]